MPRPFIQLSRAELLEVLQQFEFKRKINAVHMHHTWLPRHSHYRGVDNIESMYRDHVVHRGFSDIAQHITISPDGTVWTGRSWNQPPASAKGHNGTSIIGPFMFEMIGDFDTGEDPFGGEQKRTALEVIAHVQRKFNLLPETLRFHNQMSDKTCPGDAIDYRSFLEEVRTEHERLTDGSRGPAARADGEAPFSSEYATEEGLWDGKTVASRLSQPHIEEALAQLSHSVPRGIEEDAELTETELTEAQKSLLSGADDFTETLTTPGARGEKLTPDQKARLRPHVINLKQGRLVKGGDFFTLPGDVEAIFGEHLEEAIQRTSGGKPFRLLFFAHGGLVSEAAGLAIARKHIDWWLDNGIYPIYFVWETGFLQTVGQILRGAQTRGIADWFTDPLLEKAARLLGGERIWAGMKANAEVAAQSGNGADFVASQLKAFCDRHPNVELHAVGHSAGAIFHSYFLPAAFEKSVPAFKSVHFMAPAIRVDSFLTLLEPRIGQEIKHLTIYTMKTDFERADHCAHIYRKSLLYLIYHALEAEDEADLLGLEESVRRYPKLTKLFGLSGSSSSTGQVVFSKTLASTGRNASQSTSHGGFDDDPPTMNSVALRVLGLTDNRDLKEYPRAKAVDLLEEDVWGPPDLSELGIPPQPTSSFTPAGPGAGRPPMPLMPVPPRLNPVAAVAGARRALCVGINNYVTRPLSGCVADARLWESTLRSLGFSTTTLLDEEATYENLRAGLRQLIQSSRPGDVIVFQFSGHGTQAEDLDGDELSGPDEALCPVDFHTGALLIDDDIAKILSELPEGVNFTLFMDNCFSGDITRFALGQAARALGPEANPRFLPMTEELAQAHAAFRQQARGGPRGVRRGLQQPLRGVLFAACREDELAWEVNQQGEFTIRAVRLLQQGLEAITNQEFQQRVVTAFGTSPRQHPTLRCQDRHLAEGLLIPHAGGTPARGPAGPGADLGLIADELRYLADRLRGLRVGQ